MAQCIHCRKQYIAHDSDTESWKEYACSEACATAYEAEVECVAETQANLVPGEAHGYLQAGIPAYNYWVSGSCTKDASPEERPFRLMVAAISAKQAAEVAKSDLENADLICTNVESVEVGSRISA